MYEKNMIGFQFNCMNSLLCLINFLLPSPIKFTLFANNLCLGGLLSSLPNIQSPVLNKDRLNNYLNN